MPANDDRTLLVAGHNGSHVFPCHPIFSRLVRFAHAKPPRIALRDHNTAVEATHLQLLSDVLAYRERVRDALSDDARKAILLGQEVYIAILAPGGYEFAVAILAALALGAAVVPVAVVLPPEEALYFVTKSRAAAILVAGSSLRLGLEVEKLVKNSNPRSQLACVPVAPSLSTTPLSPSDLKVSSNLYLDDNAPGVVIFTSGTTGPPKGAVMRRAFVFDEAMSVADHYAVTQDDVLLHLLPVHHATGIGIMFFPFLVAGALIEFKSGSFDPAWTWERWRKGTTGQQTLFFSGVPTIYMRMMRWFQQKIAPHSDAQAYIDGARSIRACICGTSALASPIADFWTKILRRKVLLRYGSTEVGAVLRMPLNDEDAPYGSVGKVSPGVDLVLSEGEEGEILTRSPGMFSKFLFDPDATIASHTKDGRYRTGDIARREGEYYWILGRDSVDIIKSGGYKISALDIEREILSLPYVAEVMVVGIPDVEFGERVAATICLKEPTDVAPEDRKYLLRNLDISRLRQDLRSRLAGYKMPTVLRVLSKELPKSGTGKVVKKILGPRFFPHDTYKKMSEVQVWYRKSESNF